VGRSSTSVESRARVAQRVLASGGRALAAWLLALAAAGGPARADEAWREIAPGLQHRTLEIPTEDGDRVDGHAFRADLRRVRVGVLDARRAGRPRATAPELLAESGALVAVNGGFFDERGAPLGLVVSGGVVRNPLRRVDWGVFSVRAGTASIVHTREYEASPGVEAAVQVGPRLVVNGRPTPLKPQTSRRSAVCVHRDGRVTLLVTGAVEAGDLARFLAAPAAGGGLACADALNLDGGPSTQLAARAGDFSLDVAGGWPVPNAVAFLPR
jgi:uncharacterized protein YigE (DUF2233 family)